MGNPAAWTRNICIESIPSPARSSESKAHDEKNMHLTLCTARKEHNCMLAPIWLEHPHPHLTPTLDHGNCDSGSTVYQDLDVLVLLLNQWREPVLNNTMHLDFGRNHRRWLQPPILEHLDHGDIVLWQDSQNCSASQWTPAICTG
jgi:hypothetical protein